MAAHGTTCDKLLVLGDDTFTIETAYTAVTRGRDRNQLTSPGPTWTPTTTATRDLATSSTP